MACLRNSRRRQCAFWLRCNELRSRKIHLTCTMSADDQDLAVPWRRFCSDLWPVRLGFMVDRLTQEKWFLRILQLCFVNSIPLKLGTHSFTTDANLRHTQHREASQWTKSWNTDRNKNIHFFVTKPRPIWGLNPAPWRTHTLVAIVEAWNYHLSLLEFKCLCVCVCVCVCVCGCVCGKCALNFPRNMTAYRWIKQSNLKGIYPI